MTLAKLSQGSGELPLVAQRVAEVEVRFGEVRVECDRLAVLLDRRVQLLLDIQGDAEVVVGHGVYCDVIVAWRWSPFVITRVVHAVGIYYLDGRLYQAMVVSAIVAKDKAEVSKFLDSFKLRDKVLEQIARATKGAKAVRHEKEPSAVSSPWT